MGSQYDIEDMMALCPKVRSLSVMKEGNKMDKVKSMLCLNFKNCLSMMLLNVFVICLFALCNLWANDTDDHGYRKTSGPILSQVKE